LQEKYYSGPSILDKAIYNQDYYVEKIRNNFLINFLVYFIFFIYLALLMIINMIVKFEKILFLKKANSKALGNEQVSLNIEYKL
jgi:hypothetical protein